MTYVSTDFTITTWGLRQGKQVWRVSWRERRGQHADITGPDDGYDALARIGDVLERLPWQPDEPRA